MTGSGDCRVGMKVLGRGSTQGTQGIRPEPLTRKIPALLHAAGCSACREAPSSSIGTERFVTARADGVQDELPTAGLAHEVE